MRLNLFLHWVVTLSLLYKSVEIIIKILSIHSHFPDDILAGIEDVDFSRFNSKEGSYQQIIPSMVHFFHYSNESELEFWEAASIRAAIEFGGADTVVIHSFHTDISGRYIQLLEEAGIKDEQIIYNRMQPVTQLFGHPVSESFMYSLSRLLVLEELGGIILPPGAIMLGNLSDILKYECSGFWGTTNTTEIIMTHRRSRIINAARDHFRLWGMPGGDPLARVGQTQPQLCHGFQSQVLEGDSPLLNSTQGRHLAEIISNRIVLLDRKHVQELTHESVAHMAGNIPALLRRAWYGSYLFA